MVKKRVPLCLSRNLKTRGIYPGANLCGLHVTAQHTLCKTRVDLLSSEQGKKTVLIFRE
jgi:hypothetical protein